MPFIKEITVLLHNEIDDDNYRSNGTNFRNKVGSSVTIFMIGI